MPCCVRVGWASWCMCLFPLPLTEPPSSLPSPGDTSTPLSTAITQHHCFYFYYLLHCTTGVFMLVNVCMCVCMYVNVCLWVYVYICVCRKVKLDVSDEGKVDLEVVGKDSRAEGAVHTHTYTYIYTYIHTYIHTHIHTHIHTCMLYSPHLH